MNSRDIVLGRIRNALSDRPQVELPAPPTVWPETSADVETMTQRFADELATVEGEFFRCGSMEEAQRQIAGLVSQLQCEAVAGVDRPLAREATAALDADTICWAPKHKGAEAAGGDDDGKQWQPPEMEKIQLGILTADYLLSDTGSCVIECNNPQERLMCYLPPNCLIVARTADLREHMPAAWGEIASRTAQPDRRGEFVIVTGPSRTADIEKVLILGVHGPKRLLVVLIG